MKRPKSAAVVPDQRPAPHSATLTGTQGIRYGDKEPAIPAVPCTIHAPVDGGVVMRPPLSREAPAASHLADDDREAGEVTRTVAVDRLRKYSPPTAPNGDRDA